LTVVSRFGEFRYVAGPGLHFKMPLIDGTQAYRTDIRAMSPEKGVNTYTIDNQEVDAVYTAFNRVPANRVAYIFTNNRDYESRLAAMTLDRLKAAMGQVNVQSVAEKRGELRDAIKATLDHDVEVLGVEITDFQLTDMQYTDAFRQASTTRLCRKPISNRSNTSGSRHRSRLRPRGSKRRATPMQCANRPKTPPTRGYCKHRRKPKLLRCRAKPRPRQSAPRPMR
jgi:regulator of protease activity HflC (stomatin/prohibitin superfamily)